MEAVIGRTGGRVGARVVVIGAGIGGLSAATHLARGGYDVTVLEKNPRPGGRCDRIERDGHRFDTGPTLFLLPHLFEAELSALGTSTERELDLLRVDPNYVLVFADGEQLRLGSDLAAMRPRLEALEPGSHAGLLAYLREGSRLYHGAVEPFVRRDFRSLRDLASPRALASALRLRPFRSHWRGVARHFRTDRLRAAFTFQDAYMGMSPAETPSTFSLIPYSELVHGVWYPRGGMYAVTEALTRLALDAGVRFHFRADVREITIEGGRATGVRLRSGAHLPADVVLANADLSWVCEHLLPAEGRARRSVGGRFSHSSISFFWGVDQPIEALGPHTLLLADDTLRSFRQISRGRVLPSSPNIYVHAPARIDADMAPSGEDTLVVVVPTAHLDSRRGDDWPRLKERARRSVFEGLARMGIRDLQSHIKFEISFTPGSWQRRYNLTHGALHGLDNRLTQLGAFRPHNRHPRYENLYFAGASTHPGTGVPTTMVSGRLAAERILQERPVSARRTGSGRISLRQAA